MRFSETLLVRLDEGAVGALCRAGVGFGIIPGVVAVMGEAGSGWVLVAGVVTILGLLRLAPLVIRRVLPFSGGAQEVWRKRRQMAKRYDSYQWQKLLWIGAGMALYLAMWGAGRVSDVALAAVCVAAGGTGLARWRAVASGRRGSVGS